MLKDVRHCLEEGQAAGVPFPAAAAAREVLSAAVGRGHGDDDFAAVIEVLEGLAGRGCSSTALSRSPNADSAPILDFAVLVQGSGQSRRPGPQSGAPGFLCCSQR